MSRGMRVSVLGLYNADSGLFSEMVYPSGFTADEKQTTVGNILAECAELECLFPDPDTLKSMIGLWSKMNIQMIELILIPVMMLINLPEVMDRVYQTVILLQTPVLILIQTVFNHMILILFSLMIKPSCNMVMLFLILALALLQLLLVEKKHIRMVKK